MNQECTIYKTANFIGKRWTLLILLELYKGETTKRYSQLKKCLPKITPKILSERLKELEKESLVKKTIDTSEVPLKCFYSLTESGEDFINIIKKMKKWTIKWKNPENQLCNPVSCKHCRF